MQTGCAPSRQSPRARIRCPPLHCLAHGTICGVNVARTLRGDVGVIVVRADDDGHVYAFSIDELRPHLRSSAALSRRPFPVAGRNGLATIKAQLVNMRDGGFISAHDFHIATLIAEVVCGGDVDAGSLVTEEYLMALERKAFCSLIVNPKTQERIMGMLNTGKPVRN